MLNVAIAVWTYSTVALGVLLLVVVAVQTTARLVSAGLRRLAPPAPPAPSVTLFELPAMLPTPRPQLAERTPATAGR